jgi:glycosyltransferase involved in cell wall biosynthesis
MSVGGGHGVGQPTDPLTGASGPLMSVVVCTYSRARMSQLLETLQSLESQTYPNREVHVVVDHNPGLASELKGMADDSVRVVESSGQRGLSGARNSGVADARGEIVAFIDDDASADPTWLERLAEPYQDENVLGTGGGILAVWEGEGKPRWLPDEFLWVMGCSYRGLPDGGPVRNVIGCNMSFRSRVFEAVGGFHSAVGRLGTAPLGCEETELTIRALNLWPEGRIMYIPEAVVYHHVPESRQTMSYFVRRCFAEGLSKAVVRKMVGGAALTSERSYASRVLVAGILRNLRSALLMRNVGSSLSQALAIWVGLAATGLGFLVGSVRFRAGAASETG